MNEQLDIEIESLKKQLTGDFMKDMDIKDQIHRLEMQKNNIKPSSGEIECVGCGS